MRLAVLFFLLLFIACSDESTEILKQDITVYNTTNASFPSNQIQAIAVRYGVIWLGSPSGLVRIEDNQVKSYTHHDANLPSDFITAITTDDKGNIWIGTDEGLVQYDGDDWLVIEKFQDHLITKLLYDDIHQILWIGTDKGLGQWNGAIWERYDDPGSNLIDMFVSSIAIDPQGTLWMGSFDHFAFVGRVLTYKNNNWTSYKLDQQNLNSSFPDALAIDSDGIVWLGTRGTMGGMVVRIDGETWDIYNRQNTPCLTGGAINTIVMEGNTTWLASAQGISSLSNGVWNCHTQTNEKLPDDHILTMAIDTEGNKYFGTLNSGLVILHN